MKTEFIDWNKAHKTPKRAVLSLGGFDSIHLGHQALIQQVLLSAKEKQTSSCLCVFDPLPFQVLRAEKNFKRLFTIEETKEILKDLNLDFFCVLPFNISFSKLNPEEFVKTIVKHFEPLQIVIGYDFSFAHKRQGDFSLLKQMGQKWNFTVQQMPAFLQKGKPVSSSRIRKALSLAKMEELKELLGRPFSILAPVVRGEGRGRLLGFPTANLQIKNKELPPVGVYRARAYLEGNWHKAVLNIGRCPTFSASGQEIKLEVHIISGDFDIYGQNLRLELEGFLRKERAFSNKEELKRAIKQDIQKTLSF